MSSLIGAVRLLGLVFFLFGALVLTVVFFPWFSQARRGRATRWWSRLLLGIAGMRLRTAGRELPRELAESGVADWTSGRLVLANHISWIDIFALNAALPSRFVAKAEIGRWPLVGKMVGAAGTLYIERGRRHAVASMNDHVASHLKRGETVAVFAEGTTTSGDTLLPFHSNLVAPAIEVGCEVWPVALAYRSGGERSLAPAYVGELSLAQSVWQIVSTPGLEVEVAFLEPQDAADGTRHEVTEAARMAIARHLGLAVEPRRRAAERRLSPAPAPADNAPESLGDQAGTPQ